MDMSADNVSMLWKRISLSKRSADANNLFYSPLRFKFKTDISHLPEWHHSTVEFWVTQQHLVTQILVNSLTKQGSHPQFQVLCGCRWMHSWCVSVYPNVIFSFPRLGLSFFFFAHLNVSALAGDNATVSKMSALKCNISYTETCEAAWIYLFSWNSDQKWCLYQLPQPSQSWISHPIPMFSKSPASLLRHPPFPACSAPCELCTNID